MFPEPFARWAEKTYVELLSRAPLRAYTQVVHHLARVPIPQAIRPALLKNVASLLHMDLSEAELKLADYPSINALFVRKLREGSRPVTDDVDAVACPSDGRISAAGVIDGNTLVQAKGIDYRVDDLLADSELTQRLSGGVFVTIHLRPRDYHRVHLPVDGLINAVGHVPGTLLPVMPPFVRHRRGLYVKNERVIIDIKSDRFGQVALVCVGATAVGAIDVSFAPCVTDGWLRNIDLWGPKGMDVAQFNLGSTVILLVERGALVPGATEQGVSVRVGQPLAMLREQAKTQ